jgi:hypothetical protein
MINLMLRSAPQERVSKHVTLILESALTGEPGQVAAKAGWKWIVPWGTGAPNETPSTN